MEIDTLKVKKAWEVALGPVKGLPMTFIMMYMSGNSLQIFSIMMVFMAFKNPITGLIGTNQAFERFETQSNRAKMLQVKLAYVAMQLLALGLGIWKVNAMGLLPCVADAPWMPCCRAYRRSILTLHIGQHGRIGSHGRPRGNLWSLPFRPYSCRRRRTDLGRMPRCYNAIINKGCGI